MSIKRKRPPAAIRKAKPTSKPRRSADGELLRVDWVLPQGCTPAEKLAALEALAEHHGVKPIDNPDDMIGDFWPATKSVDEFVAAVRRWRREGRGDAR